MAPTNTEIARTFEEVAELLELKGESPFKVNAWRHAAQVVRDSTGRART